MTTARTQETRPSSSSRSKRDVLMSNIYLLTCIVGGVEYQLCDTDNVSLATRATPAYEQDTLWYNSTRPTTTRSSDSRPTTTWSTDTRPSTTWAQEPRI